MPSAAVDDAWHEFILFTRDYDRFCQKAFGQFLHHTPTAGLGVASPRDVMRDGYIVAWHYACAVDGVDPFNPERLPLLFALDEQLNYPAGFAFDVEAIRMERSEARRLLDNVPVSIVAGAPATGWWPRHHDSNGCTGGTTLIAAQGASMCGGGAGCGAGGGCGGG
jgi:hypothetical protein